MRKHHITIEMNQKASTCDQVFVCATGRDKNFMKRNIAKFGIEMFQAILSLVTLTINEFQTRNPRSSNFCSALTLR